MYLSIFFVADTQLYKRPLFVHWSVGLLVRLSVYLLVMIELISGKTSVLDTFCVCLCVRGEDWGLVGGWRPLPTHQQQYCGPASLVVYVSELGRELGGGLGVNEGCRPVRYNIVTPPHLFFLFL